MENTATSQLQLDEASFRTALADLLRERAAATLLGAQLAPIVRRCLPEDTDFKSFIPVGRPTRLVDFIKLFASGVVEPTEERRGVDLIYRVDASLVATDESGATGQLWKSFVAVEPSKNLVYDRETGELRAREVGAEALAQLLGIPPLSFAEHKLICQRFAEKLQEQGDTENVQALANILANYQPKSYPIWLRTLRTAQPPLDKSWGEFRQDSILDFFKRRLGHLGLTEPRVSELCTLLRKDHEQSILGKPSVQNVVETHTATVPATPLRDPKDKRTRELLHAAIDRMTPEQLNGLLVPFGLIVEVLSSTSSQ